MTVIQINRALYWGVAEMVIKDAKFIGGPALFFDVSWKTILKYAGFHEFYEKMSDAQKLLFKNKLWEALKHYINYYHISCAVIFDSGNAEIFGRKDFLELVKNYIGGELNAVKTPKGEAKTKDEQASSKNPFCSLKARKGEKKNKFFQFPRPENDNTLDEEDQQMLIQELEPDLASKFHRVEIGITNCVPKILELVLEDISFGEYPGVAYPTLWDDDGKRTLVISVTGRDPITLPLIQHEMPEKPWHLNVPVPHPVQKTTDEW